jgi:hypothetical protein
VGKTVYNRSGRNLAPATEILSRDHVAELLSQGWNNERKRR